MEEVFMKAGEGHDSNIKAIKDDGPSGEKFCHLAVVLLIQQFGVLIYTIHAFHFISI